MANRKKELEKAKKEGDAIVEKNKKASTVKNTPPKVDEETEKKLKEMEPKANKVAQTVKEAKMPKKEETEIKKTETDIVTPETAARQGYIEKVPEVTPSNGGTTEVKEEIVEKEPDTEVPKELEENLFESEEGKAAQEAIDSNDITVLSAITNPETGESVLQGEFTEDGKWVPYTKADVEDPRLFTRSQAMALTLISCVLSAFTGGMFPPINFLALDKQDWFVEKMQQVNQQYADLVNGTAKERNDARAEAEKKAIDYDLAQKATPEGIAKMGQFEEAAAGGTGLQQAQLNADLAKQLKSMDIDWNRDALQLTQEQQIKMAELLYDQEVQKTINQIKAMKEQGYSIDDIAKQVSSQQGMTTLARGLGYAEQGGSVIGNIISAIMPIAKSDKNIKKFDAKPVNNILLKKSFKWR